MRHRRCLALKEDLRGRYRSEEIQTNSPKPPERKRLADLESGPVHQSPLPAVLDEPIELSALDQPLPAVLDEPIELSALDQPLPAVLDEPIEPSALDQPLPAVLDEPIEPSAPWTNHCRPSWTSPLSPPRWTNHCRPRTWC